jgi:hypothetical protein
MMRTRTRRSGGGWMKEIRSMGEDEELERHGDLVGTLARR